MARSTAGYSALNGSKFEYKVGQTWTQIFGLKTIPDIGGEPNYIDTTDLDNTEFETSIVGLKPAQNLTFEFNCENPASTANIKIASDMEDTGNEYDFKLTYSNGITVEFKSKVRTTIVGGSTGDLAGFSMHVSPVGEPVITIPTTSI